MDGYGLNNSVEKTSSAQSFCLDTIDACEKPPTTPLPFPSHTSDDGEEESQLA